ncbi:unnamed protein product [Caenorhabditis auriculariae]|uniref:Endoplasmic reticulum-Golgi intermediate compartment protein 2 n=1 Tax=Caenorhabditis auriculariae TaxID=2777116 RepID=A0A8S1GZJ1_9PELO|nr:unnamed protein product [Caenorhabditis auriculariae]
MEIDTSGIRQRRGITKIVEDLDIFDKVVENVKEEKRASAGFISFVFFSAIFILFFMETYEFFFSNRYEYKFDVDIAMTETPILDIDMIVATPCNALQVASSMDQQMSTGMFSPLQSSIKKDPTRFEFTPEEQMYWTVLRHAHSKINEQGFRGIEDLQYVDSDVESNLEQLADEKQRREAEEIAEHRKEEQRKNGGRKHPSGQVMFLVGNGMGMFQLVADAGGDNEGSACRIHGRFPVRKAKEEKIDLILGTFPIGLKKFTFGPRIRGLVAPLSGAEHISEGGQDVYRYFIKIVPTKIYGYFSYTMAYQYSVTFLKKKLQEGEHSHGGILFEYEFTANVIEVHRMTTSFVTFLIRLCSILGGVYATSTIVNSVVQLILSLFYPDQEKAAPIQYETLQNSLSPDSPTSFVLNSSIKVH